MNDLALSQLYKRVTAWQRRTFPDQTAASILKHMWKELAEIAAAPHDVEERADMAILAMGYADRTALDMPSPTFYSWGFDSSLEAIRGLSLHLIDVQLRKELRLTALLARCSMGTGLSFQQFLAAIAAKMDKNEARRWPPPSEQVPGEPVEHVREPACSHCNDSHRMTLGEREVPCTRCPRPCESCRVGAYCRSPSCLCECHGIKRACEPLGGAAPWAGVRGTLTILAPSSNTLVSLVEPVPGVVFHRPDLVTIRDLVAERTEWRANNDRLRAERQLVREILGARTSEGVVDAARRVMVRPVDASPGAALAPGEEAPQ